MRWNPWHNIFKADRDPPHYSTSVFTVDREMPPTAGIQPSDVSRKGGEGAWSTSTGYNLRRTAVRSKERKERKKTRDGFTEYRESVDVEAR